MKPWGILIAICGGLWLLGALGMDTSVSTGMGGRVQNIGLLADRQNYILISCLMLLVGIGMAVVGGRSESAPAHPVKTRAVEPPCDRDLTLDAYRLWLADRYGISRNDLFDRFVCEGKTFETLDAALHHADQLETNRVQEAADRESLETANEQWQDEQRTQTLRAIAVILLIGIVLYAIF